MPLYVYHCDQCDQDFEKMVRFSEADQAQPCPTCQGKETHKKVSSFASFGAGAASSGYGSTSSGCGSSGGRFT